METPREKQNRILRACFNANKDACVIVFCDSYSAKSKYARFRITLLYCTTEVLLDITNHTALLINSRLDKKRHLLVWNKFESIKPTLEKEFTVLAGRKISVKVI